MDGPTKTVQGRRIHSDLHFVVQVSVFHFAQKTKELVILETPEGFEVGESLLAKVSGVEGPPEFSGNANR